MRAGPDGIAAALLALLVGGAAGASKAPAKTPAPARPPAPLFAPHTSTFVPPPPFPDLGLAPGAPPASEVTAGSFVFRWPLDRIVITSHFGGRKKPLRKKKSRAHGFHGGLDLDGDLGEIIHAAGPGRVAHAGWFFGYGNLVVVNHADGFQTLYGHMSEVHVFVGEMVRAGATLGLVGSTGTSTGTHLHFGAYYKGKLVDPEPLIGTSSAAFVAGSVADEEGAPDEPAAPAPAPAHGKGH